MTDSPPGTPPALEPTRVFPQAFALFKERFLLFAILSGIFAAAALVGLAPLAAAVLLALIGRAGPPAWIAGGLIGVSWVLWCMTGWQTAVLQALLSPQPGPSPWDCARRGLGRAAPFSWAWLLWFLFVMGGLWVFVLPGLYLAVALSLAPLIVVSENAGGFSSILRSLDRVQGRFWSLAGNLAPAAVLSLAASLLPGPLGLLAGGASGFFLSAVLVASYRNLPAIQEPEPGGANARRLPRIVLAVSGMGLLIPSFLLYRAAASVSALLPGLIAQWHASTALPGLPDVQKLLPSLPGIPSR